MILIYLRQGKCCPISQLLTIQLLAGIHQDHNEVNLLKGIESCPLKLLDVPWRVEDPNGEWMIF
jgi:hypothetical protein